MFFRFAWRGAMGPIVTILGLDIGYLLGGAILTEETFGLHGIGALSIKAVRDNDLPLLLGWSWWPPRRTSWWTRCTR